MTDLLNADFGSLAAPIELKFVDASEPGIFEGYGSIYGNVDSHGDVVMPGAFGASLTAHKARGSLPGLFVEHGPYTGGDPLPAGRWLDIREDAKGLFVKGKVSALDTDHGRRIRGLMQDGALSGLSIAYSVPAGGSDKADLPEGAKRRLKTIDLHSIDIVTNPSNPAARVAQVKSFTSQVDLERFLRSAGVARSAASRLAAKGWPGLAREDDLTDDHQALAEIGSVLDRAYLKLTGK